MARKKFIELPKLVSYSVVAWKITRLRTMKRMQAWLVRCQRAVTGSLKDSMEALYIFIKNLWYWLAVTE